MAHTTLQFRVEDVAGVASLQIVVVVSGQPSNAVIVGVSPPVLSSVRLYDTTSLVGARKAALRASL